MLCLQLQILQQTNYKTLKNKKMNRILTLSIMLISVFGFSNVALAQTNSGKTPAIGTSHDYWVNANADGSSHTSGVGNNYTWYITKDLATIENAATTTEFTVTGAYNTPTSNLYKVSILWKAPSAGTTYYLHVIETDGTTGCSNHKVEIITPFSDFQLAIVNVAHNDLVNAAADDLKVCAPNVALSLNGAAVEYNYGTTALYYKVDATNIDAANYVLEYNIDVNAAFTGTVNASFSTDGGTSYSALTNYVDGSDVTETITNAANSSTVIIKVELVNGTGFEGTDAHDVTVKLVSGTQGAALATLPGDTDKKQDIPARPSTSGIGSN
jgi:hypothetical protein